MESRFSSHTSKIENMGCWHVLRDMAWHGMAEPQLTRSRWRIYGAQIPSWIRAIISMGWWGVESYIIAEAAGYIYLLATSPADIQTLSNFLGPGALPAHFPTVFWTTFALVILAQLLL